MVESATVLTLETISRAGPGVLAFVLLHGVLSLWRRYRHREDVHSSSTQAQITALTATVTGLRDDLRGAQERHDQSLKEAREAHARDSGGLQEELGEVHGEATSTLRTLLAVSEARAAELTADLRRCNDARVREAMRLTGAAQAMEGATAATDRALTTLEQTQGLLLRHVLPSLVPGGPTALTLPPSHPKPGSPGENSP